MNSPRVQRRFTYRGQSGSMSTPANPPVQHFTNWLRRSSLTFKLVVIVFLGLLLLIPLGMVNGLLEERLQRQRETVEDIRNSWGKEQTIIGPLLRLPYEKKVSKERRELVNGELKTFPYTETKRGEIVLLPQKLTVTGGLTPHQRYRGIYETVVYSAELQLSGGFTPPDLTELGITPEDIQWTKGTVFISVSDLRGASRQLEITLGDEQLELLPGSQLRCANSGVHATTPNLKAWTGQLPFALDLQLNGSGRLQVAPLGVETDMSLNSSWPDPSFQGAFLPAVQEITPEGFTARWNVTYYGRDYSQQFTDHGSPSTLSQKTFASSLFGVELVQIMDTYRPVERAIKYGVLVLVLVFGTFFLFELIAGMRVHTLQYTLIGGALILFYLALLAVSEFLGFGPAYALGAVAATGLITVYSRSILGAGRSTFIILGGLTGVYGFLYITLQMQDYSLLSGTLGLFLLLAVAMYVTRHLHEREPSEPSSSGSDNPTPPPVPPQD